LVVIVGMGSSLLPNLLEWAPEEYPEFG